MFDLKENVSLAELTSFRIGGVAKYFVEVENKIQLENVLHWAQENSLKFFVLGGGTNVLISDKGFDGLVIKNKLKKFEVKENIMTVGAGVPLMRVVKKSVEAGLGGLETLAGIPGTVGGAVRGNAGAYGSEIGEFVESVLVFDVQRRETKIFAKEMCQFSYRSSIFKKNSNLIIMEVRIAPVAGDKEKIQQKMQLTIAERVAKGLGGIRSAGSFFVNPQVESNELLVKFSQDFGKSSKNGKIPAGWLIEQVGLKGKKIGGAMVNEKHANYIMNAENAKAEDVVMLASVIKQKVRADLGIQLEQEVDFVGF